MLRVKYCSFCGKHNKEVERLFDGPGAVSICNECVVQMHERLGRNTVVQMFDKWAPRLPEPPERKESDEAAQK
jgi:ATP-dependent Clp protease ATP-binding subunit ClpX